MEQTSGFNRVFGVMQRPLIYERELRQPQRLRAYLALAPVIGGWALGGL